MTEIIYATIIVSGMECVDGPNISMESHGTLETKGIKMKWSANFTSTWNVSLEKEIEEAHEIKQQIAGILGYVNVPTRRVFTYEKRS